MKAYLDRATEIIGDRSSGEIQHDDAVVAALNQGRTIKEALAVASSLFPEEAILWDDNNIGDIAAHYEYLQEHSRILEKVKNLPAPAHSEKLGRNDPCSCGSGKKFKKCCGAN